MLLHLQIQRMSSNILGAEQVAMSGHLHSHVYGSNLCPKLHVVVEQGSHLHSYGFRVENGGQRRLHLNAPISVLFPCLLLSLLSSSGSFASCKMQKIFISLSSCRGSIKTVAFSFSRFSQTGTIMEYNYRATKHLLTPLL